MRLAIKLTVLVAAIAGALGAAPASADPPPWDPQGNFRLFNVARQGCMVGPGTGANPYHWAGCPAYYPDQDWNFGSHSDGTHRIRNLVSNLCLTSPNLNNNADLTQAPCDGRPGQKWSVNYTGSGNVWVLQRAGHNLCAVVYANTSRVQQWSCAGYPDSHWDLRQ